MANVTARDIESLLICPFPIWKRMVDIVGASIVLALAAPVMLLSIVAIKLTSRGPFLFKQTRIGQGGKPFTMYKFRSMVIDAEQRKPDLLHRNDRRGPAFKMKHDPRVTPVGRILRKFSLDELPQLINVLQGHMSLVGPRPLPSAETLAFKPWQRARLQVKPGLTCIWQVTLRNDDNFDKWVRLDIEYVQKHSLLMDLLLLIRTIPAVISGKGAY
jgi:lipopolysaccharide/colanic/teichoic acid biosynthesis glycosyltransferase